MEHDQAFTVLASVGALFVLVIASMVLYQRSKRERTRLAEESEKNDKLRTQMEAKARTWLKEAVDAGTHLPTGEKRCLIEDCPLAAKKPGIVFARGEGWRDYVKRLFGAPPRYTVKNKKAESEPDLCEGHVPLAREVAKERLARHEQKRVTLMMEEEAELAHFEHVGLVARTSELAKKAREGGRLVSIQQQRRVGG